MGQDTARPMMMPPPPSPPFVGAHAQVLRAVLATRFHGPPPPAQPHQRGQRGIRWGMAHGGLPLAGHAGAPQDQPDRRAGPALAPGDAPQCRKAGHQGPLAALLERPTPPAGRRPRSGQRCDGVGLGFARQAPGPCRFASLARPSRDRRGRPGPPALGVGWDRGHVLQAQAVDVVAQAGRAPQGFGTDDPARPPGASPRPPAAWLCRGAPRAPHRVAAAWHTPRPPPTPAARTGGAPIAWSPGGWPSPRSPQRARAPASRLPRRLAASHRPLPAPVAATRCRPT